MISIHRRCALGVSALLISFATLAPTAHAQDVTIPIGQSLYISTSSPFFNTIGRIAGGSTAATADANTSVFASVLGSPTGLAFDSAGNLYAANATSNGNSSISKITSTGAVSTFVSSGLNFPYGLAFDSAGNLYAANYNGNTISKITSTGAVSTFVSSGLSGPLGLAFDSAGNLYAANLNGNSISKITSTGAVSTFASGLSTPYGLAFDGVGNFYATTDYNDSISKITSTGTVSTLVSGFATTGLNIPEGLAFDSAGDLFIANHGDTTIRTISKASLASGNPTVNLFATLPRDVHPEFLAFGPSPAVPDAGSAWLVVAGLPLLGYVAYRRRRRAA